MTGGGGPVSAAMARLTAMTRRPGPIAAATVVLAAAVSALTTPAAAADPLFQAPTVGQCHDLSADEVAAPSHTEAAVDCASPHTATTIAVTVLPDGLAYDSPRFEQVALGSCFPAQRRALGTSLVAIRLSAFTVGYFSPTPEQQAAGARWLRCDLLLGSPDDPRPLPATLELGQLPYAAGVSRCLERGYELAPCSDPHTFRATGAVRVTGKRYPTRTDWRLIGNRECLGEVTTRSFRFGWPSRAAWKAGDRALLCYSRTRR